MISPSLLYQIFGKLTLVLISLDSFFSFSFYKYLSLLFSYWTFPLISCLLLFTHGFSEFSISLCLENGVVKATKTAICNFLIFSFFFVLYMLFIYLMRINVFFTKAFSFSYTLSNSVLLKFFFLSFFFYLKPSS